MHYSLIEKPKLTHKTLAAIVIGNALEWYDFIVYSFVTVFIAKLFFPAADHTTSLLAATATFGVGFFMRPIGGIILGVYADRHGRKKVMTFVIALMTIALLLLASAPTYASIGILAPSLILLARLLQGFSASGEFGSATALLIELSPKNRRGLYGSWQMFGQVSAIVIGGTIGILLTKFLTEAQLAAWGWRLPFVVGLIIAPIGIYIRKHLHEDLLQMPSEDMRYTPLSYTQQCQRMLLAIGLAVAGTTSIYANLIYMPTFASKYLQISMHQAFVAVALGGLVCIVLTPLFGLLSDYIDRKRIVIVALTLYALTVIPCFMWMTYQPTFTKLVLGELLCCTIFSAYVGVFTTILAELFPRNIRATGLSISNNLAIMLFGGFGQFIVTWLIQVSGSLLAPSFYVTFGAIISLISAILLTKQKVLTHEYPSLAFASHRI